MSKKIRTFAPDLKKDFEKIYPSMTLTTISIMTLTTNSMFNFTPPYEWA